MRSKIFYTKPSITAREAELAADAAVNGWGAHCYDYINKFEDGFRRYVGTDFAVATSSATGALHLGLAGLGVGAGDEVILADTNWIASVAPVVHLGATPVFVDILPDTWCLDPQKVENAITPRTKAILAVHLYGNLCDMDALEKIAEKHGLFLIEDAAEALGSHWGTVRAGSRGVFGAFSFHGTKTMTTGEGGMLVTNNPGLYEKVLTLNNHGRARGEKRQFWASVVGYKFKMSNIQAAIGCAQLERIEELCARRREIFHTYRRLLSPYPEIRLNPVPTDAEYGYWIPSAIFAQQTDVRQDDVLAAFSAENIDGRAFFWPLSLQADFLPRRENIVSYDIPQRAVNLPSYHEIDEYDQRRVVEVLANLLER